MVYRTFVLSTSAKPEDVIILNVENNKVVLGPFAGEGIIQTPGSGGGNTEEDHVDGGSF
jgi:hypothetical protein